MEHVNFWLTTYLSSGLSKKEFVERESEIIKSAIPKMKRLQDELIAEMCEVLEYKEVAK